MLHFNFKSRYLKFSLSNLNSDFSVQLLDSTIEHELPEQVRFSKPKPIVTTNEKMLFNQIVTEYVGDEYFKKTDEATILTPKEQMINLLEKNKLLGKANYKFNPNKPGIFQWQSVDDVFLMVVD